MADPLEVSGNSDDPEWLERPQHYDRGKTAARFGGRLSRLEGDFAARRTDEQDTQGSSEYGRVVGSAGGVLRVGEASAYATPRSGLSTFHFRPRQ
ncbi:hypothetical protein ACWD3Z_36630 [Streptomyces sp. NPDC002740]